MKRKLLLILILAVVVVKIKAAENFKVSIYCTRFDVEKLSDKKYFDTHIELLQQTLHIDKVYLEVHRQTSLDLKTMLKVKKYFNDAGIETAAGITATKPRGNHKYFKVLCYSNEDDVDMILDAVKIAASGFDECILDDFFFTSCKCDKCIAAKGDMSWTEFRLNKMTEISKLLVSEAKKINPKIKMVIKYPNWYAYYQMTGYNLDTQPHIFDGVYTGTETRDRVYTNQNLQPYQSYSIMRYLDNVSDGRNGGGWVDPLACGNLNRYSQQLMLTLLSGAKEITLFNWSSMFRQSGEDEILSPYAYTASNTFVQFDSFAQEIGTPQGLYFYKPVNSYGDSFLASYLGMIGIPVEPVSVFPTEASSVFIPESAYADKTILKKIKSFLSNGGTVIVSSGFLQKMQDEGIGEFISSRVDGVVQIARMSDLRFKQIDAMKSKILIPKIENPTNDVWSEFLGMTSSGNSYPLLSYTNYSKGSFYVLTVPGNFSDLYTYSANILYKIKNNILDQNVVLESDSQISMFLYDNNTIVIQSFVDHNETAKLHFKDKTILSNVILNKTVSPDCKEKARDFSFNIPANGYLVLKFK